MIMRGAPPSRWVHRCCSLVFLPHSGRDEEDYIEALETVRTILVEGRKAGAVDFFIGGDMNILLKLPKEDLHGFDSTMFQHVKRKA